MEIAKNIKPSVTENQQVNLVLKNYSIEPLKIEKIRSVYKITTENKTYCLKKLKHGSTKKVLKGYSLSKHLVANSFYGILKYVKTNDNKPFIKYRHNIYYVTNWIKGREVNYSDFSEVKRCFGLMAEFHQKSAGFASESFISSNLYAWPQIFMKERELLGNFKEIICSKKIKTMFDIEYEKNIDTYIDKIDQCIIQINSSAYIDLCDASSANKSVCHDSFYYQNVIVKSSGKMFLIDLDSSLYDIIPYDIAKLLRRILYKSSYNWNFELAKEMLETYTSIKPLSRSELEVLLIFIMFPQKFCKLGKKRYISREMWFESKYLQKLNRIVRNIETEQSFANDFKNYFLSK